jgi:hypothetical protein
MATDAPSGSFDLPSVAKRSFGRRWTTDFYFLGIQNNCHQAERKVDARPTTRPLQQARNNLAGKRLFLAG